MWYNAKAGPLNRMWNVEYGTRMQTTRHCNEVMCDEGLNETFNLKFVLG